MNPVKSIILNLLGPFFQKIFYRFNQDMLDTHLLHHSFELHSMRLKPGVNDLIPFVSIKDGFIGKIYGKLHLSQLSTMPFSFEVEDVFLLVGPAPIDPSPEASRTRLVKKQSQKLSKLLQHEAQATDDTDQSQFATSSAVKLLQSTLIEYIINSRFIIKNIHIRYEDPTEPSLFLAFGATLSMLSIQTTNEKWLNPQNSDEATGYKLLDLSGFSLYWDRTLLSHLHHTPLINTLREMVNTLNSLDNVKPLLEPLSLVIQMKYSKPSKTETKPLISAHVIVDSLVLHIGEDRISPVLLGGMQLMGSAEQQEHQNMRPFSGPIGHDLLKSSNKIDKFRLQHPEFPLPQAYSSLLSHYMEVNQTNHSTIPESSPFSTVITTNQFSTTKLTPLVIDSLQNTTLSDKSSAGLTSVVRTLIKNRVRLLWNWTIKCILGIVQERRKSYNLEYIATVRRKDRLEYIKLRVLYCKALAACSEVDKNVDDMKKEKAGFSMKRRFEETYRQMWTKTSEMVVNDQLKAKLEHFPTENITAVDKIRSAFTEMHDKMKDFKEKERESKEKIDAIESKKREKEMFHASLATMDKAERKQAKEDRKKMKRNVKEEERKKEKIQKKENDQERKIDDDLEKWEKKFEKRTQEDKAKKEKEGIDIPLLTDEELLALGMEVKAMNRLIELETKYPFEDITFFRMFAEIQLRQEKKAREKEKVTVVTQSREDPQNPFSMVKTLTSQASVPTLAQISSQNPMTPRPTPSLQSPGIPSRTPSVFSKYHPRHSKSSSSHSRPSTPQTDRSTPIEECHTGMFDPSWRLFCIGLDLKSVSVVLYDSVRKRRSKKQDRVAEGLIKITALETRGELAFRPYRGGVDVNFLIKDGEILDISDRTINVFKRILRAKREPKAIGSPQTASTPEWDRDPEQRGVTHPLWEGTGLVSIDISYHPVERWSDMRAHINVGDAILIIPLIPVTRIFHAISSLLLFESSMNTAKENVQQRVETFLSPSTDPISISHTPHSPDLGSSGSSTLFRAVKREQKKKHSLDSLFFTKEYLSIQMKKVMSVMSTNFKMILLGRLPLDVSVQFNEMDLYIPIDCAIPNSECAYVCWDHCGFSTEFSRLGGKLATVTDVLVPNLASDNVNSSTSPDLQMSPTTISRRHSTVQLRPLALSPSSSSILSQPVATRGFVPPQSPTLEQNIGDILEGPALSYQGSATVLPNEPPDDWRITNKQLLAESYLDRYDFHLEHLSIAIKRPYLYEEEKIGEYENYWRDRDNECEWYLAKDAWTHHQKPVLVGKPIEWIARDIIANGAILNSLFKHSSVVPLSSFFAQINQLHVHINEKTLRQLIDVFFSIYNLFALPQSLSELSTSRQTLDESIISDFDTPQTSTFPKTQSMYLEDSRGIMTEMKLLRIHYKQIMQHVPILPDHRTEYEVESLRIQLAVCRTSFDKDGNIIVRPALKSEETVIQSTNINLPTLIISFGSGLSQHDSSEVEATISGLEFKLVKRPYSGCMGFRVQSAEMVASKKKKKSTILSALSSFRSKNSYFAEQFQAAESAMTPPSQSISPFSQSFLPRGLFGDNNSHHTTTDQSPLSNPLAKPPLKGRVLPRSSIDTTEAFWRKMSSLHRSVFRMGFPSLGHVPSRQSMAILPNRSEKQASNPFAPSPNRPFTVVGIEWISSCSKYKEDEKRRIGVKFEPVVIGIDRIVLIDVLETVNTLVQNITHLTSSMQSHPQPSPTPSPPPFFGEMSLAIDPIPHLPTAQDHEHISLIQVQTQPSFQASTQRPKVRPIILTSPDEENLKKQWELRSYLLHPDDRTVPEQPRRQNQNNVSLAFDVSLLDVAFYGEDNVDALAAASSAHAVIKLGEDSTAVKASVGSIGFYQINEKIQKSPIHKSGLLTPNTPPTITIDTRSAMNGFVQIGSEGNKLLTNLPFFSSVRPAKAADLDLFISHHRLTTSKIIGTVGPIVGSFEGSYIGSLVGYIMTCQQIVRTINTIVTSKDSQSSSMTPESPSLARPERYVPPPPSDFIEPLRPFMSTLSLDVKLDEIDLIIWGLGNEASVDPIGVQLVMQKGWAKHPSPSASVTQLGLNLFSFLEKKSSSVPKFPVATLELPKSTPILYPFDASIDLVLKNKSEIGDILKDNPTLLVGDSFWFGTGHLSELRMDFLREEMYAVMECVGRSMSSYSFGFNAEKRKNEAAQKEFQDKLQLKQDVRETTQVANPPIKTVGHHNKQKRIKRLQKKLDEMSPAKTEKVERPHDLLLKRRPLVFFLNVVMDGIYIGLNLHQPDHRNNGALVRRTLIEASLQKTPFQLLVHSKDPLFLSDYSSMPNINVELTHLIGDIKLSLHSLTEKDETITLTIQHAVSRLLFMNGGLVYGLTTPTLMIGTTRNPSSILQSTPSQKPPLSKQSSKVNQEYSFSSQLLSKRRDYTEELLLILKPLFHQGPLDQVDRADDFKQHNIEFILTSAPKQDSNNVSFFVSVSETSLILEKSEIDIVVAVLSSLVQDTSWNLIDAVNSINQGAFSLTQTGLDVEETLSTVRPEPKPEKLNNINLSVSVASLNFSVLNEQSEAITLTMTKTSILYQNEPSEQSISFTLGQLLCVDSMERTKKSGTRLYPFLFGLITSTEAEHCLTGVVRIGTENTRKGPRPTVDLIVRCAPLHIVALTVTIRRILHLSDGVIEIVRQFQTIQIPQAEGSNKDKEQFDEKRIPVLFSADAVIQSPVIYIPKTSTSRELFILNLGHVVCTNTDIYVSPQTESVDQPTPTPSPMPDRAPTPMQSPEMVYLYVQNVSICSAKLAPGKLLTPHISLSTDYQVSQLPPRPPRVPSKPKPSRNSHISSQFARLLQQCSIDSYVEILANFDVSADVSFDTNTEQTSTLGIDVKCSDLCIEIDERQLGWLETFFEKNILESYQDPSLSHNVIRSKKPEPKPVPPQPSQISLVPHQNLPQKQAFTELVPQVATSPKTVIASGPIQQPQPTLYQALMTDLSDVMNQSEIDFEPFDELESFIDQPPQSEPEDVWEEHSYPSQIARQLLTEQNEGLSEVVLKLRAKLPLLKIDMFEGYRPLSKPKKLQPDDTKVKRTWSEVLQTVVKDFSISFDSSGDQSIVADLSIGDVVLRDTRPRRNDSFEDESESDEPKRTRHIREVFPLSRFRLPTADFHSQFLSILCDDHSAHAIHIAARFHPKKGFTADMSILHPRILLNDNFDVKLVGIILDHVFVFKTSLEAITSNLSPSSSDSSPDPSKGEAERPTDPPESLTPTSTDIAHPPSGLSQTPTSGTSSPGSSFTYPPDSSSPMAESFVLKAPPPKPFIATLMSITLNIIDLEICLINDPTDPQSTALIIGGGICLNCHLSPPVDSDLFRVISDASRDDAPTLTSLAMCSSHSSFAQRLANNGILLRPIPFQRGGSQPLMVSPLGTFEHLPSISQVSLANHSHSFVPLSKSLSFSSEIPLFGNLAQSSEEIPHSFSRIPPSKTPPLTNYHFMKTLFSELQAVVSCEFTSFRLYETRLASQLDKDGLNKERVITENLSLRLDFEGLLCGSEDCFVPSLDRMITPSPQSIDAAHLLSVQPNLDVLHLVPTYSKPGIALVDFDCSFPNGVLVSFGLRDELWVEFIVHFVKNMTKIVDSSPMVAQKKQQEEATKIVAENSLLKAIQPIPSRSPTPTKANENKKILNLLDAAKASSPFTEKKVGPPRRRYRTKPRVSYDSWFFASFAHSTKKHEVSNHKSSQPFSLQHITQVLLRVGLNSSGFDLRLHTEENYSTIDNALCRVYIGGIHAEFTVSGSGKSFYSSLERQDRKPTPSTQVNSTQSTPTQPLALDSQTFAAIPELTDSVRLESRSEVRLDSFVVAYGTFFTSVLIELLNEKKLVRERLMDKFEILLELSPRMIAITHPNIKQAMDEKDVNCLKDPFGTALSTLSRIIPPFNPLVPPSLINAPPQAIADALILPHTLSAVMSKELLITIKPEMITAMERLVEELFFERYLWTEGVQQMKKQRKIQQYYQRYNKSKPIIVNGSIVENGGPSLSASHVGHSTILPDSSVRTFLSSENLPWKKHTTNKTNSVSSDGSFILRNETGTTVSFHCDDSSGSLEIPEKIGLSTRLEPSMSFRPKPKGSKETTVEDGEESWLDFSFGDSSKSDNQIAKTNRNLHLRIEGFMSLPSINAATLNTESFQLTLKDGTKTDVWVRLQLFIRGTQRIILISSHVIVTNNTDMTMSCMFVRPSSHSSVRKTLKPNDVLFVPITSLLSGLSFRPSAGNEPEGYEWIQSWSWTQPVSITKLKDGQNGYLVCEDKITRQDPAKASHSAPSAIKNAHQSNVQMTFSLNCHKRSAEYIPDLINPSKRIFNNLYESIIRPQADVIEPDLSLKELQTKADMMLEVSLCIPLTIENTLPLPICAELFHPTGELCYVLKSLGDEEIFGQDPPIVPPSPNKEPASALLTSFSTPFSYRTKHAYPYYSQFSSAMSQQTYDQQSLNQVMHSTLIWLAPGDTLNLYHLPFESDIAARFCFAEARTTKKKLRDHEPGSELLRPMDAHLFDSSDSDSSNSIAQMETAAILSDTNVSESETAFAHSAISETDNTTPILTTLQKNKASSAKKKTRWIRLEKKIAQSELLRKSNQKEIEFSFNGVWTRTFMLRRGKQNKQLFIDKVSFFLQSEKLLSRLHLHVFAPYWIVSHTSYPLVFKEVPGKTVPQGQGNTQKAPLPKQTIVASVPSQSVYNLPWKIIDTDAGNETDRKRKEQRPTKDFLAYPLPFTFFTHTPSLQNTSRLSIMSALPQKEGENDPIGIDTIGLSASVTVPDNHLRYDLSVSIANMTIPFHNTKIVTVSTRYCLNNMSDLFIVYVREAGIESAVVKQGLTFSHHQYTKVLLPHHDPYHLIWMNSESEGFKNKLVSFAVRRASEERNKATEFIGLNWSGNVWIDKSGHSSVLVVLSSDKANSVKQQAILVHLHSTEEKNTKSLQIQIFCELCQPKHQPPDAISVTDPPIITPALTETQIETHQMPNPPFFITNKTRHGFLITQQDSNELTLSIPPYSSVPFALFNPHLKPTLLIRVQEPFQTVRHTVSYPKMPTAGVYSGPVSSSHPQPSEPTVFISPTSFFNSKESNKSFFQWNALDEEYVLDLSELNTIPPIQFNDENDRNRAISILVLANGPCRVIDISSLSHRIAHKADTTIRQRSFQLYVSCSFRRIGLSLITNEGMWPTTPPRGTVSEQNTPRPFEFLYVSLSQLVVLAALSSSGQTFDFTLYNMQIDNNLRGSEFPVVLSGQTSKLFNHFTIIDSMGDEFGSPKIANPAKLAQAKPLIRIMVNAVVNEKTGKRRSSANSILHIRTGLLECDAINVKIEEKLIWRFQKYLDELKLINFFGTVLGIVDKRNRSFTHRAPLTSQTRKDTIGLFNIVQFAPQIEALSSNTNAISVVQKSSSTFAFADQFQIKPFTFRLVSHTAGDDPGRQSTLIRFLFSFLGATMMNVDTSLTLDGLFLTNVYEDASQLMNRIGNHYKMQLILNVYRVVLGMDMLGNPIGLIRGLGSGVHDLYSETVRGLRSGPTGIVGGLWTGVSKMGGKTLSSIGGVVSKVSQAASKGISSLMPSKPAQSHPQRQPKNPLQGLEKGAQAFGSEVWKGATGVVTETMEGARESGVKGAVKGIASGAVGAVLHPLNGGLQFISHTFEGIKNIGMDEDDDQKVRYTRYIGANGEVDPYNKEKSRGFEQLLDVTALSPAEELEFALTIRQSNKRVLIVTNQRVLYLRETRGDREQLQLRWELPLSQIKGVRLNNADIIFHLSETSPQYSKTKELVAHAQDTGMARTVKTQFDRVKR
ncbi:putative Vacuolar protein sorting-associated protein 13C [Blattamonas nauphoetae]|uniref:Vacuolar protein sorting-associated protein 13C n=1 Tax=Blattamonas nauphoetae TaxID=2049346 RepID=A0ABQ9Y2V8_9EUKA|nr:putative Vacuolar protein sorting-associated protein 13C [Blattamonas nauphoetae]